MIFTNNTETLGILAVSFSEVQVGTLNNNGVPTIWEKEEVTYNSVLVGSKIPFVSGRVAYNRYGGTTKTSIFYRSNSGEYGVFVNQPY